MDVFKVKCATGQNDILRMYVTPDGEETRFFIDRGPTTFSVYATIEQAIELAKLILSEANYVSEKEKELAERVAFLENYNPVPDNAKTQATDGDAW